MQDFARIAVKIPMQKRIPDQFKDFLKGPLDFWM